MTFESPKKIALFRWPHPYCRIPWACNDVISINAELQAGYQITMSLQSKLIGNRFDIPNLQRIFYHRSYQIGLTTEGNSAFLG